MSYTLAPTTCMKENQNFWFRDVESISGVKDWQECSRLCQGNDDCFGWVYQTVKGTGKCWLKNKNYDYGSTTFDEGVYTGPKQCPSGMSGLT